LIRHLLNVVDQEYQVGLISDTNRSDFELLRRVLFAFGVDYQSPLRTELYDRFVTFLVDVYAQNRCAVLIIDEAQNMGPEALEELRTLSNINADKHQLLQLILVGQPELRPILRRPELRQFAQRIAVDYHLTPLSSEETPRYIAHRLQVAGGDPALFTPEACALIHEVSGGVPRIINVLSETALVYAYGAYSEKVDVKVVEEVIRDKSDGGLVRMEGGSAAGDQQTRVVPSAFAAHQDGSGANALERHSEPAEASAILYQGLHVIANEAYLELFGVADLRSLIGMPMTTIIAPQDRSAVRVYLESEGRAGRLSVSGMLPDNGVVPVDLEFHPHQYRGQHCVKVAATLIDASKHLMPKQV
jgi:type II secretory pathway predicted ATPase ExeA